MLFRFSFQMQKCVTGMWLFFL